ncbi:MAG: ABC transporter substrate-binding protein [Prevotella sp.]|nr:ABC transporter substrate-binding protein [Prevotella sp.]
MKRIFYGCFIAFLMAFVAQTAYCQTQKWREIHKVKKKETIFGIARQYGITIQELVDANPEMNTPGYELKKDSYICIPYPKTQNSSSQTVETPVSVSRQPVQAPLKMRVKGTPIRLGVMLPLHDINGDGRRMVEYYRGILMACDSLKRMGISVDVHAWNTPDNEDIAPVLREKAARQCDLIIGPLYSKQMAQLSEFVAENGIRLVIPFSINAPQLATNPNIFQVYQSPGTQNEATIAQFVKRFGGCHPVFIDCNDSTSTKGGFTSGLRRKLEASGIEYSLTNLKSSEANFAKAFSRIKPNVVVLNTGRSPELNVAAAKLNGMTATYPDLKITLFGYTEWLMYTKHQLDNFYKYDAYIPSTFHYTPLTSNTLRFQKKYISNFHQDMMNSLPRFAITGFDHAMFFLMGIYRFGNDFTGAPGLLGYDAIQTPLRFQRVGSGGHQNNSQVFVHYLPEHRMEVINY